MLKFVIVWAGGRSFFYAFCEFVPNCCKMSLVIILKCLSIIFTLETVMRSHLVGKKHLALINFRQSQQSLADRSIFVRGFQFGTTDVELKNLFSIYGNVVKVVINKEQVSMF
jgi:hypothetical protein